MPNNKNCASCAYFDSNQFACVLTRTATSADSSCSRHATNPTVCATCGSYIIDKSIFTQSPKGWLEICTKCAKALGTCAGCKLGGYCAFEQDPSPLPKVVSQTIRQGNAVMQTQVRNPERIRLLCEKCPCFNIEDKECDRMFNTCPNHRCILDP